VADPKFNPENFRQILHSGYTLIRSIETSKAISALTLDHMIQNHLDALGGPELDKKKNSGSRVSLLVDDKGKSLGERQSRWDQIDEIEKLFTKAVTELKNAGDNAEKLSQLGIVESDKNAEAK
jgi:hypothetical protein